MEVSCGPVIRYQLLPLGCERHKNFWMFLEIFRWERMLMWAGIVYFPSPFQLGSNSIAFYRFGY